MLPFLKKKTYYRVGCVLIVCFLTTEFVLFCISNLTPREHGRGLYPLRKGTAITNGYMKQLKPHNTFIYYWPNNSLLKKIKQFNQVLTDEMIKHSNVTENCMYFLHLCKETNIAGKRNFEVIRGYRTVLWSDLYRQDHAIKAKRWTDQNKNDSYGVNIDEEINEKINSIARHKHTRIFDYKTTGGPGVFTYILSSFSHWDARDLDLQYPVKKYYECYRPARVKRMGGWASISGGIPPSMCRVQCSDDVTSLVTPIDLPDYASLTDYTRLFFYTTCGDIYKATHLEEAVSDFLYNNLTADILTAIDVVTIGGVVHPMGHVLTTAYNAIHAHRCSNEPYEKLSRDNIALCQLILKSTYRREVFVISQDPPDNYYHFSIEHITRLAAFVYFLRKRPSVAIHVDDTAQNQMKKWLEIYGLKNPIVSGYVTAHIVYIPHGGGCHNPSAMSVQLASKIYHRHILSMILKHPVKLKPVILVLKRQERKIVNHVALLELLYSLARHKALEVIVFDDAQLPTLEETMLLFNRAALIIGPHGAGFSNIIFARPGTTVVDIQCTGYKNVRMCYRWLALKLGMRYYGTVTTHPVAESKRCANEGVTADLNEIRDVLTFIFSYL